MLKMNNYKLGICQKILKTICYLIVFVSISFTSHALADVALNKQVSGNIYDHWVRATDDELAQQRGGFVLPNGVTIDISLERTIFLNDVETISTFFQFPENGVLLQNGNENLAPGSIGSSLSSVLQNNLDGQLIKAINELNIEISDLQNADLDTHFNNIDALLPFLQ